jgi:hypothetical protein
LDGLATVCIVMGWIQIGLGVISFCYIIVYFGFFATLKNSNLALSVRQFFAEQIICGVKKIA